MLISLLYVLGCFINFGGIFGYILFYFWLYFRRIGKIRRNKKYVEDSVRKKMHTQTVPNQPGVLLRWGQLSFGVSKIMFIFLSLL